MSFKNRAATAIAASAASLALISGIAPSSTAQDTNAAASTRASNNGSIVVPTDSALNLRVVLVDGKPTVMISNGYTGGSNDGSNEPKPTTPKQTATKTTSAKPTETATATKTTTATATVTETAAATSAPTTTEATTKAETPTTSGAASSSTPSVSESELESRSDIDLSLIHI